MDARFAKIVRDASTGRDRILIDGVVFGLDVPLDETNSELVEMIVAALRSSDKTDLEGAQSASALA